MIARDDQAGGVGHGPADLGQPLVGGFQYPADPLPRRVERGPPGLRHLVPGHFGTEGGGELVPGPGAPAHLAGVGQEDHRADHAVLQRGPVAVHVIRGAAPAAARFVGVGDERDGVRVAAERRAGQREPAPGRVEGLLDRLPPGQRVARVVDLVEDDQRPAVLGALPVQRRVRGDLRVGDGHPGEVGTGAALGVGIAGIDRDAEPGRRLRPLMLEVLGGRDDGEPGDLAPREQFAGQGERVPGLPRPGRSDQQEVAPGQPEVLEVRVLLPAPQLGQEIISNGAVVRAHEAEMLQGSRPGAGPAHRGSVFALATGGQHVEDLLAGGTDRVTLGIPARHPYLAAEGDDGGSGHRALDDLVLVDVVREPLVIPVAVRQIGPCVFADARFLLRKSLSLAHVSESSSDGPDSDRI